MSACDSLAVQRKLNAFYLRELADPARFEIIPAAAEYGEILAIEAAWRRHEEARVAPGELPQAGENFADWYKALHRRHETALAGFFGFLAREASAEALAFYIWLEEQVDGRFDDVIALAQLGMSGEPKLALAENFWDEMGCGELEQMHTALFAVSVEHMMRHLAATKVQLPKEPPVEALKNGNLLLMYALRRQNVLRLLGAIAILEHTAPARFARTVQGLKRVGFPESVIYYHRLHVGVDHKHGEDLLNRVLLPLVETNPRAAREIAMGALVRYRVAIDYYRAVERAITTREAARGRARPSRRAVLPGAAAMPGTVPIMERIAG
jgi:hypothetical protein